MADFKQMKNNQAINSIEFLQKCLKTLPTITSLSIKFLYCTDIGTS